MKPVKLLIVQDKALSNKSLLREQQAISKVIKGSVVNLGWCQNEKFDSFG